MERYIGKSVFSGRAIGKICFFEKSAPQIRRVKIEDADKEFVRFEEAKDKAINQLREIQDKAVAQVGEVNAQIFEIQAMMLEDLDYNESIENMIRMQNVNAEYAVSTTGENFSKMFADMDDEYFKARSLDVKNISERLVDILLNKKDRVTLTEPSILVSNDLAPSETVQLDKKMLIGFVTHLGSANSHTAILARTMNIPALVGVDIDQSWDGKMAILDGYDGEVIIEPSEEVLKEYEEKIEEEKKAKALYETLKGRETITKGGRKVNLYANIGNVSDLGFVLQNDAEGIGLFRSEFIFLENDDFPTEDQQFEIYKNVASSMGGKKVIFRTLDIGADKQADYFNLPKEDNPAMGMRAIRICLSQPEIFKTQLRALIRASAYGNIAIMYPMITSVWEVRQAKQYVEEIKAEFDKIGFEYGDFEQGIMIETPASVMISDLLAKEVDFFSIGTNDLTQYTLAIDRQNQSLDNFLNTRHEAILRMIKMAADNAHDAGIWIGICGELGADLSLTEKFVEMGIDELSVSPGMVLKVRKKIREME